MYINEYGDPNDSYYAENKEKFKKGMNDFLNGCDQAVLLQALQNHVYSGRLVSAYRR